MKTDGWIACGLFIAKRRRKESERKREREKESESEEGGEGRKGSDEPVNHGRVCLR